jgi:ATP-dependent Zn protease
MNLALRLRLALNAANKVFLFFVFGCGVLAIVLIGFRLLSGPLPVQQLTYSELLQQVANRNVSEATILTSKNNAVTVSGVLKTPEKRFKVPLEIKEVENFRKHLVQAAVPTTSAAELERGSFGAYAVIGSMVLFFIIFFSVVLWMMKKTKLESRRLRSQDGK